MESITGKSKYVIINATPYATSIKDVFSLLELLYDNKLKPNETLQDFLNSEYKTQMQKYSKFRSNEQEKDCKDYLDLLYDEEQLPPNTDRQN